jgi:hypothetical protein
MGFLVTVEKAEVPQVEVIFSSRTLVTAEVIVCLQEDASTCGRTHKQWSKHIHINTREYLDKAHLQNLNRTISKINMAHWLSRVEFRTGALVQMSALSTPINLAIEVLLNKGGHGFHWVCLLAAPSSCSCRKGLQQLGRRKALSGRNQSSPLLSSLGYDYRVPRSYEFP